MGIWQKKLGKVKGFGRRKEVIQQIQQRPQNYKTMRTKLPNFSVASESGIPVPIFLILSMDYFILSDFPR